MSAARFDVILMNRVATVQYNVQRGRGREREVMSTGRFDVIVMNRVAVQCNVRRGARRWTASACCVRWDSTSSRRVPPPVSRVRRVAVGTSWEPLTSHSVNVSR